MSNIEWTERTWNPTVGCWPVSPGCLHCYAKTMTKRLAAMGQEDYAGLMNDRGDHFNGLMRELPHKLDVPLRRKKPTMWFVNSMSDLFDEQISDDFLNRVFEVMERCGQHTFQVLTKRPERMASYALWRWGKREDGPGYRIPAKNIWLGASAENQEQAIIRHRSLSDTPAALRFWSVEPLLGAIEALPLKGISWVIVGGESGSGARPCGVAWVRSIIAQCREAGVPCFVKQLGAMPLPEAITGLVEVFGGGRVQIPHRSPLRDRKGGDPSEWPEDLRVREFPQSKVPA